MEIGATYDHQYKMTDHELDTKFKCKKDLYDYLNILQCARMEICGIATTLVQIIESTNLHRPALMCCRKCSVMM